MVFDESPVFYDLLVLGERLLFQDSLNKKLTRLYSLLALVIALRGDVPTLGNRLRLPS